MQKLFEKLSYLSPRDRSFVKKAYLFAKKAHLGQRRASGEPYISHPLKVAEYLADYRFEKEVISAGLLHDVCEDTEVSLKDIEKRFGKTVALLVDGVSFLGKLQTHAKLDFEKSRRKIELSKLQKLILAGAKDIRVIFIRLLDRKHNLKTLSVFPPQKQKRKAKETLLLYAPLAKKLGMGKLGGELEDLAFKYLYPEIYRQIKKLRAKYLPGTKKVIKSVERKLKKELKKRGIKVVASDCRIKHLYSLYQKLKRYEMDISRIYDLAALRIIVKTKEDCYRTLGVIHQFFPPMIGRIKDYIAHPKPNGYQSLHTTVFVKGEKPIEIQIRTLKMHYHAEYGLAAHWLYKEEYSAKDISLWLKTLRFSLRKKYDLSQIFKDSVYVFTPRGEVKELPEGATALDFAFAIHTDIGLRAQIALINGKPASLETPLQNGDIVEIKTASRPLTSALWLEKVKTPEARRKIRSFLRQQDKSEKISATKKMVLARLKTFGISADKWEQKMEEILRTFNLKEPEELYLKLSEGEIKLGRVLHRFFFAPTKSQIPRTRKVKGEVVVSGEENLKVKFAQCCHPEPPDKIVGYVSKEGIISVHKTTCPMLAYLDKTRFLPAWWKGEQKALRIVALDRPGLLKDIAEIFAEHQINILAIHSGPPDRENITEIEVAFEQPAVLDLFQLADKLHQVQGVKQVIFMS